MTPMADLIIRMTADVARLQKDMRAARTTVDGAMVNIQRSTARATRAMQGFIGAISIRGLAQLSDQFRTINAVLKIATGSIQAGQLAFRQSVATAMETGQAFESVAVIYRRFAENAKELRINQQQVAEATRTVAQSLALSGGSYQSTQAALLQFSQALASGVLRGQELNSVLEQAPRLARLIADGIGIPIGQLRTLAAEGKVTSQVMLEALSNQKDIIDKEFLEMPLTFARAINNLKTSVTILVGMANESTSAFSGLAQAIDFVAQNLVSLVNVITALAIGAVTRMAITYSAMAASAIAASTATSGLIAVLAGLGGAGPIGLIMGAAAALVYFTEKSNDAETSAEALANSLGLANGELERLTKTQAEAKILELTINLAELEAQAVSTAAELDNLNAQMVDPEAQLVLGGQTSTKLAALNKQIANYKKLLGELENQSTKTAQTQDVLLAEVVAVGKAGKSAGQTIEELIEKYRRETDAMIMSTHEKERAAFTQALLNEGVKEGTKAYKEYLDLFDTARIERRTLESQLQSIEREKQANEARLRERIRAEEEFAREAQRINDQIGQSLTDALVEGGVSAKDFLIKMFRTLILRPILQPVISGVLGAMGVGATGAAMAGGEVSELGQATGLMGVVGAVKGAVDMVTGGFAALGTSVSNLAVDAGFELMSMGFQDAGFAMIDASAALGSAATVLGGVAAGLAAGTLISGQFKVGGDQMISTGVGTAIGTGIGLAFGGPIGGAIGAAIGGAVGGLVNRAFGMGPKELFRSGVALDIGAGGLAETSFGFADTKQRGGLFRSDKEARQRFGVDGELADFFNQSAMAIANSVRGMTESFGLSTDEINNIQIHGVVETFGRTEEEITAQVDQILFDLQESLIRGLIPNIDAFANATDTSVGGVLQRLSASLTVVNSTFDVLGFSLYDLTLAGGDAASKMIDLVGGIEAFTAATSFYYENFYSAEERANKQLEQMTELFATMGMVLPNSRDAFRALVESAEAAGNQALVASLLQIAPSFISMKKAMEELPQAMEAVTESVEENARELQRIANERSSLEGRLLQLQGNTTELRRRELDAIDASNRGLQEQIYAIEDALAAVDSARINLDRAMAALERSVRSERNSALKTLKANHDALMSSLQAQAQAAQANTQVAREAVNSLSSLFGYISGQVQDLNQEINGARSASQGMEFIARALTTAQRTGYLPTQEDLSSAVSAARGGLTPENFATSFEMRRTQAQLAGRLSLLGELTKTQLTTAEKQLAAAELTVETINARIEQAQELYASEVERTNAYYDKIIEDAQAQIDAINGMDTSIIKVEDAVKGVSSAIEQLATAVQAQAASQAAARALVPVGGGGGSVGGMTTSQVPQSRSAQITAMYQDILGRAPDAAGFSYWSAHQSPIDQIRAGIEQSAEARALRGFADGGMYSGGLAMVGERGPELINFNNPGMVYSNQQLRSAMTGNDTATEIRQLREENRAQSRAMVALQARMTRVIEQWNGDGLPNERFEDVTA
jgi:tape measure domain-containing protein